MTKLHLGLGLLLGGLLAWGCSSTSTGTGAFAQSTGPGVGLGTGGTPGLGAGRGNGVGAGPGLNNGAATGPDGGSFRAHATGCDANNNCAKCSPTPTKNPKKKSCLCQENYGG